MNPRPSRYFMGVTPTRRFTVLGASTLPSLLAGFSTTLGVKTPFGTSDHLGRITVEDLYPDIDAEQLDELLPLSRELAMSVPAIAKARHTIVVAIAGLPLVPTRPAEQLPRLFRQLDPGRANVITLAHVVDDLFFTGRSWLQKLSPREAVTGRPLALRWVPESSITLDEHGRPTHLAGVPVARDELVLIEGVHEGVLSAHAGLTIRRSRRADSAAARAMDNPVPSVELHQTVGDPLSDAEIDRLTKRWADARRGRNGGVAYTSPAIEARMHGQAAEQLLINGRNASAIDCARVAGVPAWVVDASTSGSSLTYSNVPSRSRELLDYTLRGYLDAIAGRLSIDDITPHGQGMRFDVTRLLRGDFAERMNAGATAIGAGIYSADEIRALDDDTPSTIPTTSTSTESEPDNARP